MRTEAGRQRYVAPGALLVNRTAVGQAAQTVQLRVEKLDVENRIGQAEAALWQLLPAGRKPPRRRRCEGIRRVSPTHPQRLSEGLEELRPRGCGAVVQSHRASDRR